MNQKHVINHLTGEVAEGETRNVLVESARIARGNIKDIKDVQANDLDGLVIPGGFGAAKNLTSFADDGIDCEIHREVRRLNQDHGGPNETYRGSLHCSCSTCQGLGG